MRVEESRLLAYASGPDSLSQVIHTHASLTIDTYVVRNDEVACTDNDDDVDQTLSMLPRMVTGYS